MCNRIRNSEGCKGVIHLNDSTRLWEVVAGQNDLDKLYNKKQIHLLHVDKIQNDLNTPYKKYSCASSEDSN